MSSSVRLSAGALAAREQLREGRARIRSLHDRGLDGVQVCAKLTSLVDSVVQQLFDVILAELDEEVTGSLRSQIALVAHGGYGRRQSAPFSDVDLMILYQGRETDGIAKLARGMTRGIFDAGLQLGQSVRSVGDAVSLARTDPIICTSLIDSRLLVGTQPVFEDFRTNFESLVRKRSNPLAHAFLEARAKERNQYGETVYLLEPHIKRSRGGMRDLHLLRWLGFAEHGVADPDRLHLMGAISKFDHHRVLSARAYLLRIRNEMHFHANSVKETLDRAEQLRIAEKLAYRSNGSNRAVGMLPVEKFMRDYFRHTNHLWNMIRRREAGLEISSRVTKLLDPLLGKTVDGNYRIGIRSIGTTPAGMSKLKSDLGEVLKLVRLSADRGKPIDHATWSALFLAAPNYSEESASAVAAQFYELLAESKHVGELLRILHELGLLEKIIPPMQHARCLLQFNQYHKFTVDEHCLRAVRKAAQFALRTDALGEAYLEVKDWRVLHLALLLHDLGKGFDEDHSEVGRRLAIEMAEHLGLDASQAEDLAFLVHRHLMMAHLAFRRDTSDERLIERFAAEVESPDRLRMLFVLTCADLAAVGPGVLNDWKVEVLTTLYRRTARLLKEGEGPSTESKFDDLRKRVLKQLTAAELNDPWFQQQTTALPTSYLTRRDPVEAAETLRRLRKLSDPDAPKSHTGVTSDLSASGSLGRIDVWAAYLPETKTVEFIAGVENGLGRGVFSSMAGALSSKGLEILAADSETLAGNLLFLRYVVAESGELGGARRELSDSQLAPHNPQLNALCEKLKSSVDSNVPPKFRRVWGQDQTESSARLSTAKNDVKIANDISDRCTVIEVFTFDRTGLLYRLARKLHDQNLIIRHAIIGTSLDQVVDVFYVTERSGEKVTNENRQTTIREEMFATIDAKTDDAKSLESHV